MDQDEITLERQRLGIEERRVAIEERQARHSFWTRLGIVIPVLAALIAFGAGVVNQRLNDRDALSLQRAKANDDFELKVAEIVMNGDSPFEARGRAVALSELFPDHLDARFARNFNPEDATDRKTSARDQRVAAKKELLKLIAEHPAEREQIISTWRRLFPGDTWAQALE